MIHTRAIEHFFFKHELSGKYGRNISEILRGNKVTMDFGNCLHEEMPYIR